MAFGFDASGSEGEKREIDNTRRRESSQGGKGIYIYTELHTCGPSSKVLPAYTGGTQRMLIHQSVEFKERHDENKTHGAVPTFDPKKLPQERPHHRPARTTLLSSRLNGVSVLARDDFDLLGLHDLVRFHFERRVRHDECPHIVAEAVRLQVALKERFAC